MRWTRLPTGYLLMLVLAATALWIFLGVTEGVFLDGAHTLDRKILLAFRHQTDPAVPLGPPWLHEVANDLTALGGYSVLTLVTIAAAGFLLLIRHYRTSLYLTVSVVSGTFLVNFLKAAFGRSRPDITPVISEFHTHSFPSGHAALSAIVYLTIAALITRVLPDFRTKAYVVGLAVFVTLLVGLTRIYLGVHWPSDVLGGWTLGAAWALIWWAASRRLWGRQPLDSGGG